MRVRFLADADLNRAIVAGLLRRESAVDFLTAHAAGLRGLHDREVLALAADQKRILVYHDVNTLPIHFRAFLDSERRSPGVFLAPQSFPVASVMEDLLLVWLASDAADWENRLEWLPLRF